MQNGAGSLYYEMEKWERLPDGLMIASPANPTGAVLSDLNWRISAVGVTQRCASDFDEIYHGLAYGQDGTALNYTKNAIIINSLSNTFP